MEIEGVVDRMTRFITSPGRFAQVFNAKVPGAYRRITALDVRDMAECGLIGRYGYYGRTDLETARAILLYEQLRDERNQRPYSEHRRCKRCGQLLLVNEGKKRRPNEYCPDCEPLRGRERWRKWRNRQISVLSVY